ncbi:NCS2 family permease [Thalassomonas actiniarum]|uniref:NCS2 family permease n=1 Tax=Thalassomonas actiniarum TaxID=485447 RepID=A0AAF0C1Z4_9GAMM|nr:NCS2 family permease [Thalassomonas actiniarum]WDD97270.1 NCS2 family permease [Thalassomonas actiniarum]
MLERLFQLQDHKTSVKQEVIAGFTTFLTMAYIIFINPAMLADAGMDQGAVFVATCLAAAIGCFIMGFIANYPIALAPGMGLNAFFTYTVVLEMGYSWQVALGGVFISGVVFVILSLVNIREWIVNSIPHSLRFGIAAGIGLFLAFIALKNAGIVVDSPATFVTLGSVTTLEPILAALGLFLIVGLANRGVNGAVMISILVITLIGLIAGNINYTGMVSMPPSLAPTFLQLDIAGALEVGMLSVIFAFLFVDLFDTSGTLIAVAQRGNLLDKNGTLPRLGKALLADSGATVAGSMLGTSTTTSYVESTAGVSAGGRTGLTAVIVGVLFLCALFFSPLAAMVPAYATAGPLFFVAVLMLAGLINVDWSDLSEAVPVTVTLVTMPLTFSIAQGIAFGFISYAAVRIFSGRFNELNLSVTFLALLFIAKFAFFS